MASNCKIWPYRPWKMTFRAIQPNLSFDMWFMSTQRSSMPKKKKSYWSVSEMDPPPTPPPPPLNLDGWTTDKSSLEKLRCLSAGGAKKVLFAPIWFYLPLFGSKISFFFPYLPGTVQITFIFIDFRVCDFAFAFKTQNAPCVSRFKRVLFSDRFQFAF